MNRREDHFPAKSVRRKAPPRSHGRDLLHRHQLQQSGQHYPHASISGRRHDENKKRLLEVLTTIIVDPIAGADGTLDATVHPITTTISSDISVTVVEVILPIPTSLSLTPELARPIVNAILSSPIATNPAENTLAGGLFTSINNELAALLPTETTSTESPSDTSTTELWISIPTSVPDIVTEISPLTALLTFSTLSPDVTGSLELPISTSVFNTPTTLLGAVGSVPIPVPNVSTNIVSLQSRVSTLTSLSAGSTIIQSSILPLSSISVPTPSTLVFPASTLRTHANSTISATSLSSTRLTSVASTIPIHNSTVVSTATSVKTTSSVPSSITTRSTSATSSTNIVTSLPANLTSSFSSTSTPLPVLNSTTNTIFSTASSSNNSFSSSSSSISASLSGSSLSTTFASATSSFAFIPPTGGIPTTTSGPGTTPGTTKSTVVPLVPAIVGSLGGVILLAALGLLLFTYRRRRLVSRLSSGPEEFAAGPQFTTERGFTVLSGQRLDTGVSGGTPVVYREGEPTAVPSEMSRNVIASRFTEHL